MINIGSRVLADGSVCAQVEKPVQNRTLCSGLLLAVHFAQINRKLNFRIQMRVQIDTSSMIVSDLTI